MTSDNTCIIGCFQLKNENPMCEHPAHQVNVSRIGVLCAPDSRKFFGTPCIFSCLCYKTRGAYGWDLFSRTIENRQGPKGLTEFITMLVLKYMIPLKSSKLKPIQIQQCLFDRD